MRSVYQYGGRYRSRLFILSSNDTYVSVPFMIGEAPMEVVNPSVMVFRLDLVFLDSMAAG